MSYPEVYDEKLKYWNLNTLPFLPKEYKYEVIPSVEKQFNTVKNLLKRDDVESIYVATDSGREGEYIYRLVEQEAGVTGKKRKRVWIEKRLKDTAFKESFAEPVSEQVDYEIIKHKKFDMRPMDVDEAILQMNLLGHSFFMFSNAETGTINVVYKRDDGNYAVLEPDND